MEALKELLSNIENSIKSFLCSICIKIINFFQELLDDLNGGDNA